MRWHPNLAAFADSDPIHPDPDHEDLAQTPKTSPGVFAFAQGEGQGERKVQDKAEGGT